MLMPTDQVLLTYMQMLMPTLMIMLNQMLVAHQEENMELGQNLRIIFIIMTELNHQHPLQEMIDLNLQPLEETLRKNHIKQMVKVQYG